MIDLLKIGIEIQLTNLVSSELTKITKGLLGLDNATIKAIKSMGAFKTTVLGLGSFAVGAGILDGFEKIAESGNQLEKQVGFLKSQFHDMTDAQANYFRASSINIANNADFPTTASQVAAAGVDNFALFKNFDEAMRMREFAAKMKAVIGMQFNEDEEAADADYTKMLKSADIGGYTSKNGKLDPDETRRSMELFERLRVSTKGLVGAGDLVLFYKRASTALRGVSPEAAVGLSVGLMGQYGGSVSGTMLQAFHRQFIVGKMAKNLGKVMEKYGLGTPGHLVGQELLDKGDYYGYLTKIFDPLIHAAYLRQHRRGQTETSFQSQAAGQIGSTNPAGRLLTDFMANPVLLKKEMEGVGMTGTLDQQNADLKAHNLDYQMTALKDSFKNLGEELGVNILPATILGIKQLTACVKFLNKEIAAHPTIAKDLMMFAGGLGVFMVVVGGLAAFAGTIALLGAFPIVSTIAAIGTGITILAGIYAVYHAKINAWVSNIVKQTEDALSNIWTSLKNGFVKFFTNFSQWAKEFFGPGGVPGANQRTGNTAARMQKERYTPNYGGNRLPIQHISFNVDGKEVSKVVLDHAADRLNRDNSGMTGYNLRGGYTPPGLVAL